MLVRRSLRVWSFLACAMLAGSFGVDAQVGKKTADPEVKRKVEIGNKRLEVTTPGGSGSIPMFISADWSAPLPDVTRAIIMIHGLHRNAESAFKAPGPGASGALVIAPQFPTSQDIEEHKLPAEILRWRGSRWAAGEPALAPAGISSYDAIDTILARLADRTNFPRLAHVVLAGHSAGGQFMARYAAVGKAEGALLKAGIAVRYVIANPSSYLYFSRDRPAAKAGVSLLCRGFNNWRYGLSKRPPYAAGPTPEVLERGFVRRDVVYLLGTKDTEVDDDLAVGCAAQAQGPNRYQRGHIYFDYLKGRNGADLVHHLWDIEGVGHESRKMFRSACGQAALLDAAGCGGN